MYRLENITPHRRAYPVLSPRHLSPPQRITGLDQQLDTLFSICDLDE